jgi:hypothetical protein
MTPGKDFTDEEWARMRRAPTVAGVAISLADPGRPIELAQGDGGERVSAGERRMLDQVRAILGMA